ncbi:thiol-disulfide oxidoreductase DCC family protein [Glaciecola sp. SC05]|uniref:thiol-disulfide oxidoreductase DCC family protein n=1 Tax=Glaciecola sp. SC05 TaxID=1987355 RepID=UPI003527DB6F
MHKTPASSQSQHFTDGPNKAVVIYDGVCYLCNQSVQFIIKRDKYDSFLFSPLQSEYAQTLMQHYDVEHLVQDTFILVKDQKLYLQSDAALEISRSFSGAWRLLRVFKWVPKAIRDVGYRLIARNRYRLFGKADSCLLPSEAIKSKFIL